MLDRLDTWIVLGVLLWIVLCFFIAWATQMKKRLANAENRNMNLRFALNQKTNEASWLKARAESMECHGILIRDEEIDRLKKENARLEKLLEQKWKVASTDAKK